MTPLERIRAAPLGERYALLPAPLHAIVLRNQWQSKLWIRVLAAMIAAAGIGFAVYEFQPPLSPEEMSFTAIGALLALVVAPALFVMERVARHKPLIDLVERDIVWTFRVATTRGRHYLEMNCARGTSARLQLSVDGEHLDERHVAEALAALSNLHPGMRHGFGEELRNTYARDPASMLVGRAPAGAPATDPTKKARIVILVGALLCIVGYPAVRAGLKAWDTAERPTVTDVALDKQHFVFRVHTSPGATVSSCGTSQKADSMGVAAFDVPAATVRPEAHNSERKLVVSFTVKKPGYSSSYYGRVELPQPP